MSKKKRQRKAQTPKYDGNVVFRMSSIEKSLHDMPKYNGYAVGHGPHGKVGYDRNREKADFDKLIADESV